MTTQIVKYAGFEDFLTHMAEERAGAIALLHGANDRYNRVTWAGFSRDVHARADELRESGKTCLAILCDGSDTSVVELFAANIAGLQVAMLDIAVPDKPGLGVDDYNDEVIREHLHPDYPELWAETSHWDNVYSHDRLWS